MASHWVSPLPEASATATRDCAFPGDRITQCSTRPSVVARRQGLCHVGRAANVDGCGDPRKPAAHDPPDPQIGTVQHIPRAACSIWSATDPAVRCPGSTQTASEIPDSKMRQVPASNTACSYCRTPTGGASARLTSLPYQISGRCSRRSSSEVLDDLGDDMAVSAPRLRAWRVMPTSSALVVNSQGALARLTDNWSPRSPTQSTTCKSRSQSSKAPSLGCVPVRGQPG